MCKTAFVKRETRQKVFQKYYSDTFILILSLQQSFCRYYPKKFIRIFWQKTYKLK